MSNEPPEIADAETVAAPVLSAASQLEPPRWIGLYELVRRVGQGGMGEVWLAEQREPVRRRVALKIIKDGGHPRGGGPVRVGATGAHGQDTKRRASSPQPEAGYAAGGWGQVPGVAGSTQIKDGK